MPNPHFTISEVEIDEEQHIVRFWLETEYEAWLCYSYLDIDSDKLQLDKNEQDTYYEITPSGFNPKEFTAAIQAELTQQLESFSYFS